MNDDADGGDMQKLVETRSSVYGDPVDSFVRIAQVWSGIIGHDIHAYEVPLMMSGLKLVRTDITPGYSDNSDDIDGYLEIFRIIMGPDLVHARSVSEYLELLDQGARPALRVVTQLDTQLAEGEQALKEWWDSPHQHAGTDCGGGLDCPARPKETP